jgi:hypothetical protein
VCRRIAPLFALHSEIEFRLLAAVRSVVIHERWPTNARSWRIPSVPGTNLEGQQRVRCQPLVRQRATRPQPINAAMSTLAVHPVGAAATAMASATAPSILPDDRFFDSLRFPAASRSTTALAMHIVRTG